jgi:aminocarboxymuconate-semialdehyde decarboxylase
LVAIDNPVNPRNYLGKFWLDSLVHDEKMLHYIVDLVGSKRVAMGSDYPFPLGEDVPGTIIKGSSLNENQKADLLHHSALEWLNMSKDFFLEE